MAITDRCPLKRGSIHLKCSMKGQEKGDLSIQVTACAGLTVLSNRSMIIILDQVVPLKIRI